ncbi:major facilitator superfamily domain-containing protein [Biscogniauxia mediterranea]|nr:major facilitator superfamily domain-containing protein [Biscogniauxia mediterranea]
MGLVAGCHSAGVFIPFSWFFLKETSLYVAIAYGILYLLITTFSFVYSDQYGFDEGTSGLTFLAAGIGMIGVVGFGQLTDAILKRNKAKGAEHTPEMCIQNYLLDAYLQFGASVTAAMSILRSLLGVLLPLCGLQMYNTLGLGWGNSLMVFISLALVPIPVVFFIFGCQLRARFNVKL